MDTPMVKFRLLGFRSMEERLLVHRYTAYKASKAKKAHRYKVVANRDAKGRLRGWNTLYSRSGALYENVDVLKDEVLRFFRGKPVDKTRLSYMIGEYHLQQDLPEVREVLA